jgi:hypothetical protein
MEAVEILLAGMLAELGHAAADEFGPDGVLFGGIAGPGLFDEKGCGDVEFSLCQVERGCCDSHGIPYWRLLAWRSIHVL